MKTKTVAQSAVAVDDQTSPSEDVRYAVRFPVDLPVHVVTPSGEYEGRTENVSASGVLILSKDSIEVDSTVEFFLKMPKGSIGSTEDMVVQCVGRVTRCSEDAGGSHIAALIDDYRIGTDPKA